MNKVSTVMVTIVVALVATTGLVTALSMISQQTAFAANGFGFGCGKGGCSPNFGGSGSGFTGGFGEGGRADGSGGFGGGQGTGSSHCGGGSGGSGTSGFNHGGGSC